MEVGCRSSKIPQRNSLLKSTEGKVGFFEFYSGVGGDELLLVKVSRIGDHSAGLSSLKWCHCGVDKGYLSEVGALTVTRFVESKKAEVVWGPIFLSAIGASVAVLHRK